MSKEYPRNIKGFTYQLDYNPKAPPTDEDPKLRIIDESGRDHSITLNGDVVNTNDESAIRNSSIEFAGTGSDYLEIKDNMEDFNVIQNGMNFTIDFFFTIKSFSDHCMLFNKIEDDNNRYSCYISTSGQITFFARTSGSQEFQIVTSSGTILLNTRYHIAIVKNQNNYYIYLDGIIVGTTTSSYAKDYSGNLFLGFRTAGDDNLNGTIDEFRFSKGIDRTEDPNDQLYIDLTNLPDSLFEDDCSSLNGWSTDHVGSGTATQVTYDSKSCFKLDSGASTSSRSRIYKTGINFNSSMVIELSTYLDDIGTPANGEQLILRVQPTTLARLNITFSTDGLILNGNPADFNLGTLCTEDEWINWRFEIIQLSSSLFNVKTYKNNTYITTTYDAGALASVTGESIYLTQFGNTIANKLSYIDSFNLSNYGFEVPTIRYEADFGDAPGDRITSWYNECESLTGWTDLDSGGGISTQEIFDGKSCIKLDSGSSAGGYPQRRTNIGTTPSSYSIIFKTYHSAIGTNSDSDHFYITMYRTGGFMNLRCASDGLFIYNGSGVDEVGTNIVSTGEWIEWKVDVEVNTSTEKCNVTVYKNSVHQGTISNTGHTGSYTNGNIDIGQGGGTTANRITYLDSVKFETAGGAVLLIHPEEDIPGDYYEVQNGDTWYNTNDEFVRVWDDENEKWNVVVDGPGYGYVCGGYNGSTYLSTIERIEFGALDGIAKQVGSLTGSRQFSNGCNSSIHGFCLSGHDGSTYDSTIDRITFPFDSGTASNVGNLNTLKSYVAGCNSSNYGYSMGGSISGGRVSSIERITFPHNSGTATNVGNLSDMRGDMMGGFNSSIHGYTVGGYAPTAYRSNINRLTFPHDSGTAINAGNTTGTRAYTANCNSSNHGYIIGSSTGIYVSIIERITFPFNSGTATNIGSLTGTRAYGSGCNSTVHGYIMGGISGGSSVSSIERIKFPFDSGIANYISNLIIEKTYTVCIDSTDFVGQFV